MSCTLPAARPAELSRAFLDSVGDYLAWCAERSEPRRGNPAAAASRPLRLTAGGSIVEGMRREPGHDLRRLAHSRARDQHLQLRLGLSLSVQLPADLRRLPSRGRDEGREQPFGEVSLDGVLWAQLIAWPAGPRRPEQFLPIIDDRASREQVDAIFRILKGEETEPGATDLQRARRDHRQGAQAGLHPDRVRARSRRPPAAGVKGLIEAVVDRPRNPATGAEHRVQVVLPDGFEGTTRPSSPTAASWRQPPPCRSSGGTGTASSPRSR